MNPKPSGNRAKPPCRLDTVATSGKTRNSYPIEWMTESGVVQKARRESYITQGDKADEKDAEIN